MPSDSIDAVKDKERALAALSAPMARSRGGRPPPTPGARRGCRAGLPPSAGVVAEWIAAADRRAHDAARRTAARIARARAVETARRHGAFHWELAFPEVFFDADGRPAPTAGFDAVIGNPPWDMLRADIDSRRVRYPDHRAAHAGIRSQGHGHPNRYQLFLERALQLAEARRARRVDPAVGHRHRSRQRGAAPPSVRSHAIDTWLGFDNRRGIFPIHRSVRFVLLLRHAGGRTETLTIPLRPHRYRGARRRCESAGR